MTPLLALFVLHQSAPSPDADRVFAEVSKMAGGTWRGELGNGMKVALQFQLVNDGKSLEGNGTVGDPKKPLLRMHSRIGIDREAKKVYYLDDHNGEQVFFGHVTLEDGKLVFDFTSIVGGSGHWISRSQQRGDSYSGELFAVGKDGKEVTLHTTKLTRTAR